MKKFIFIALLIFVMLSGCSTPGSVDHYGKAQEYIEAGDRESAISELSAAIQDDPDNAQLYIERAYCYMMPTDVLSVEENYQKAYADFSKAQQLDPDNEEAAIGLYYAEVYRDEIEKAAEGLMEYANGKDDLSEKYQKLMDDVRDGFIRDFLGNTHMVTGYSDGKLIYTLYLRYDAGGHVRTAVSFDANGNQTGSVDTVWDGDHYSTDYIIGHKTGNLYRVEYTFDENGLLRDERQYDMEGVLSDELRYEYDEHGSRTYTYYYKNGTLLPESSSYNEYEYDSDGRVSRMYDYTLDKTLHGYIDYQYDSKCGKLSGETCYDPDGSIKWYTVSEYDENGNKTHGARYDGEGNLLDERFYK